jgi:hypothetical protein
MSSKGLWYELMALSDSKLNSIINSALDEYYRLLANVGMDIYDSCIKDFYSQYNPKVYKRHNYLAGKNLYSANEIFYDGDTVNMVLDEWNLLPYGKHDKRDIVFEFVLAGLRGGPLPRRPDFPMDWYTSYPNEYSRYRNVWQSSEIILVNILDDFCANVVNDTLPIVVNNIAKKI